MIHGMLGITISFKLPGLVLLSQNVVLQNPCPTVVVKLQLLNRNINITTDISSTLMSLRK